MASNLNDRFRDFGSTPTNDLWDKIETSLDNKKNRKPLLWLFYNTIAAVFVICLLLLLFWTQSTKITESSLSLKDSGFQKNTNKGDKINQLPGKIDPFKKHDPEIQELKKNQVEKKKWDLQKNMGSNTYEEIDYVSNNIEKDNREDKNNPNQSLLDTNKVEFAVQVHKEMNELGKFPIQKESDTSSNIVTTLNYIDSNTNEIKDALSESITKRGFEFGLSYSWFTSKIKDVIAVDNMIDLISTSNAFLLNESYTGSVSNAKFYRISVPFSFHMNVNFYFNNKWRLDSEIGYSNFRYTYLDQNKNILSHYSIFQTVSLPISISHLWYFKKSGHSINYNIGLINDFSTQNWNKNNEINYSLSGQMKMGYGYFFGPSQKWKAQLNFVVRYNLLENPTLKTHFNKRLLYGGQIGITKLF